MKKKCLEFFIIFLLVLIYNIFFARIDGDEIWCYGFIYNTANGLIPYKDFNLVVGPFYPYFFSAFLLMFGKNLFVLEIVNALVISFLFLFVKRINNRSYYLFFLILFIFSKVNYNTVCLLLLYIILFLEDDKNNDYLIGFLLGIIFLIKFNIGLFLCIPSLFIKNKKKIYKRIISFLLTITLAYLLLMLNNSFYEYINYCFLGMFEFSQNNFKFTIFGFLAIIEVIIVLYLLFIKKERNIHLLYCICFMILFYPIFEIYHVLIASLPFLAYLFDKLDVNLRIYRFCFYLFIIFFFTFCIIILSNKVMMFDKDSHILRYRLSESSYVADNKYITCYLNNIKNDADVYIFDDNAYILKMNADIPINKYDLINNGNMGFKGYYNYINEIDKNCSSNKCIFFLNDDILKSNKTQINSDIIKYVVDNYKYKEDLLYLSVYVN